MSAQISKDGKGIPGGACGRDAQRESAKEKRDVSMATNRTPVLFRDRERQIWALDGRILRCWTWYGNFGKNYAARSGEVRANGK